VAAGLVAAGLGVALLSRRPLTTDEAGALEAARGSLGAVVERALDHDPAQAGYLALLQPVASWSEAAWAVRAPSVVAAVLVAVAGTLLGTHLFGRLGGLAAGCALILNAGLVGASQQARPYALAVAAIVVTSALLVVALERESGWWWGLYALSALSLPLTHPIAISGLVAHVAAVAAAWPLVRPRLAVPALAFACVEAGFLLAAAAIDRADAVDGAGPFSLADLAHGVFRASGENPVLLALAALGLGLLAAGRTPAAEAWQAVLVWGLVAAPAAAVLVAATFVPVFPRLALVACAPGLALACGAAVAWIPVRAAAWAVVGALAVASVVGFVRWYAGTPAEDWRAAAAAIERDLGDADTVVVVPERARPAFAHAAPEIRLSGRVRGDGGWVIVRSDDDLEAVELARSAVDTPRYALLSQRRLGSDLVLQRWVRP
jgi:mannosyltransferase